MTQSAYDDYVRVCKSKGLRPSSREDMMVITKGQLLKLVEDTRNEALQEIDYEI